MIIYDLHDSLIEAVDYFADQKRVEIQIELCNWRQIGYKDSDPEILDVNMIFDGVEKYELSLSDHTFCSDAIIDVCEMDDHTVKIAFLTDNDVETIMIKAQKISFTQRISDPNQYLKKIEGGNLVNIGRAASMAWFLFVKDNEEYALHLQTSFRVTVDEKIVFAGADIFQPSKAIQTDDKIDLETFEWDVQGNNRYDESVKLFLEKYSQNLKVDEVFMNRLGDLAIQLSEKVKIEVFINMSEEECWRFFQRHSGHHLVVGAEGILQ